MLPQLLEQLEQWRGKRVCLAFSGGVDSAYLLHIMVKQGVTVLAVTFDTCLHPACDAQKAGEFARQVGAEHRILAVNEFLDPRILENPPERCYYCKFALFSSLCALAKEEGIDWVLDGTNADDHHTYRPGLRALKELGVRSPLAEAGLTKADIRRLSEADGLPTAHHPSTPCLATRLPYGTRLEPDILRRVEQGEEFLRTLGCYNIRLRTDGKAARVEVDAADFPLILEHRAAIVCRLQQLQFAPISLDLEGFRSGSYDRLRGE